MGNSRASKLCSRSVPTVDDHEGADEGQAQALGQNSMVEISSRLARRPRRRGVFEVWVLRTTSSYSNLGLLTLPYEDVLVIEQIATPSLISIWNETHPDEAQVHVGDRIVLVNDVSGAEPMLAEIQDHRPNSFLRLVLEPAPDSLASKICRNLTCQILADDARGGYQGGC